jgi:pentose-5-phosphate-3-epimerase
MIRYLVFGALLVLVSCSEIGSDGKSEQHNSSSAIDQVNKAIKARIAACVDQGLTVQTCSCITNTFARIMSAEDFLKDSELKRRNDYRETDNFLRHKFADDPNTMFALSDALQSCPGSVITAELKK